MSDPGQMRVIFKNVAVTTEQTYVLNRDGSKGLPLLKTYHRAAPSGLPACGADKGELHTIGTRLFLEGDVKLGIGESICADCRKDLIY